jgi:multiple sugar transport system substrate-binding protein
VTSAVLAACGAPAPAPTATALPTPAPVAKPRARTPILWSYWGDQKEIEINLRVKETFEAVNPTVAVDVQHEPWTTYFTRLQTGWAQHQAPDVMFLNNIPIYARTGALENLDAWVKRDRFPVEDFYPALLATYRYSGGLFGFPRDNDTKVIFYNKRLLSDARIEPPTDWTWEQFRQTALALTARQPDGAVRHWGFAYEAQNWWRLWVWQNNGDILDDHYQPKQVRLGEQASVEGIQFLADLTNASRVTPPYSDLNATRQRALFREGKVALILDNHSIVPALAEVAGLEWDVAPLARGKRRANLAGGAGYVMSAWSSQKEAAWSFLQFLAGPEGQGLFAEAGVAVPARRSVREENTFYRRRPYAFKVFRDETENGVDNYYFPRANEMNTFLDEALALVFQGRESAAEAVQKASPRLAEFIAP